VNCGFARVQLESFLEIGEGLVKKVGFTVLDTLVVVVVGAEVIGAGQEQVASSKYYGDKANVLGGRDRMVG